MPKADHASVSIRFSGLRSLRMRSANTITLNASSHSARMPYGSR